MKVFFRRLHLYMGLAAGMVIIISCLTGALLVFETELQQVFFKHRYYVTAKGTPLAAVSLIKIITEKYRI